MSGTCSNLAAPFQAAAQAAESAENTFRASVRPRLEALERDRVFAYRRMNLVADMARAAEGQDARETAVAAVIAVVTAQFALEPGRDRHETILTRLAPVADAVALTIHPSPDEDLAVPGLVAALAAFEAWYHAETGAHFLARADIAMPQTPLVDW